MERMAKLARKAALRAYAPYSRFRVGAALEADSGEVFTGCNLENASYGLTLCAERVAAGAAVSGGHRRFRRLVVATDRDEAVAPCGACRQVLAEFGDELEVYGVGRKEMTRWLLRDLIPAAFAGSVLPGRSVPDGGTRTGSR